jgi:tetratricopeptide (TPR) repeat protein
MHQGTTFTAIGFETANREPDSACAVGLEASTHKTTAEAAYELYVRADKIDDDPACYAEAEALYRRAVELDPTLAVAYTNLGNVRFRRGDQGEAADLYRRALEVDDRQAEAHYNLGYLSLNDGDPWRSILCFRRAIEAEPCFADAHVHLAVAFERRGEHRKARTHWKRYLDIEPTGTWAAAAKRRLAESAEPPSRRVAAK